MTVAVAHQVSATASLALSHAVEEAKFRGTDLAVLHVVNSALDADREEAYRIGVSDEIERAVGSDTDITWKLHLRPRAGTSVTRSWASPTGSVRTCSCSAPAAGRRRARPCSAASHRRSSWRQTSPYLW